jgi:hypothetical protein
MRSSRWSSRCEVWCEFWLDVCCILLCVAWCNTHLAPAIQHLWNMCVLSHHACLPGLRRFEGSKQQACMCTTACIETRAASAVAVLLSC